MRQSHSAFDQIPACWAGIRSWGVSEVALGAVAAAVAEVVVAGAGSESQRSAAAESSA